MKPLWIIFSVLFIDGLQISSFPNLAVKQKIGAWSFAYIALITSEVQNWLNSNSVSFIDEDRLLFGQNGFIIGLVHIDMMCNYLIGPSSAENIGD